MILYIPIIITSFITGTIIISTADIIDSVPPTFPTSSVAPNTVSKLSAKNFPTTGTVSF